jgi:hypothetical protein
MVAGAPACGEERYLFNRLATASVTPAGGNAIPLVTNSYDGPSSRCMGGLIASSAQWMHDSTYDVNMPYRGNLTQTVGLIGSNTECASYDTAGVVYQSADGSGKSVTVSTDASTSYSLPSVLTPNGNSSLQSTIGYASSWAATSLTQAGGGTGTTTYDLYGRPAQTQIPDGATTTYTYSYSPLPTQVATVNGRWKKTTLDGFGRVIQVDTGHGTVSDANTISRVVTQYAPCACSPLLKVSAVCPSRTIRTAERRCGQPIPMTAWGARYQ